MMSIVNNVSANVKMSTKFKANMVVSVMFPHCSILYKLSMNGYHSKFIKKINISYIIIYYIHILLFNINIMKLILIIEKC